MEVIMPKMGESVNEGTIIKWHKKKGETVKRDEIIFEISTDKVDTEIPSPADGVLTDIKVQEGETVDVGTVVALIESNGEVSLKSDSSEEKSEAVSEKQEQTDQVKENDEIVTRESAGRESQPAGDTIEITMPKMGESVMEGTIIKWYKKIGDKVSKDETIFEISTDKVDTEVPSPEEGVLAEILVGEQETVEVGTVVARLSTSGSVPSSKPVEKKKEEKQQVKEEKPVEEPVSMHDNFSSASLTPDDEKELMEDMGFLSPLVLSIANKEKVKPDELKSIKGTGIDGRITKKDILSYIEKRTEKPSEKIESLSDADYKSSEPKMEPVASSDGVEKIPMDNIRQKIMQHMVASRDTSVHVSAMLEVDMTRIHNFIKKNKEEFQKRENVKLTYMPFIAHAVIKGLKEFPLINSSIDGNSIIVKHYINLGIAVAIEPTGLIVPNIKGAGERNLPGLAKAINDLAHRSRNKKLSPDDISGGTFTITNYGVFGTIFGTPIINQPEVAILGVGTVVKKPVVVEVDEVDTIAIKPMMALTLSHDHRLVDGMLGGRFLKFVKDTLESFDERKM